MPEPPQHWTRQPLYIVLLLVFCAPVGLVLMWLYAPWSNKAKWIITAIAGAFMIVAGNSPDKDQEKTVAAVAPAVAPVVPTPAKEVHPETVAKPKQKLSTEAKKQAFFAEVRAVWREAKETVAKPAAPKTVRTAPKTMAGNLAIIEGVQGDALKTARIRTLLTQLDALYPENQQQIGDMTAATYAQLQKQGQEASIIGVMEAMMRASPGASQAGQSYSDTATAYLILRKNGLR